MIYRRDGERSEVTTIGVPHNLSPALPPASCAPEAPAMALSPGLLHCVSAASFIFAC